MEPSDAGHEAYLDRIARECFRAYRDETPEARAVREQAQKRIDEQVREQAQQPMPYLGLDKAGYEARNAQEKRYSERAVVAQHLAAKNASWLAVQRDNTQEPVPVQGVHCMHAYKVDWWRVNSFDELISILRAMQVTLHTDGTPEGEEHINPIRHLLREVKP